MNKRYNAQALAVVMIVIVVAVVIGLAIVARTLRDRERIASEKASAEALELSDSILDVVSGTPVSTFEDLCANPEYGDGLRSSAGCNVKGASSVSAFLENAGLSSEFMNSFASCSANGSEVSMRLSFATEEDDYEIRPDTVRSFVIRQQTPNPQACTLNMEFEPRGGQNTGVSISKVYASGYDSNGVPSNYKPYDFSDVIQYCLTRGGESCPDNDVFTDSWTPLAASSILSLPLTGTGSYELDEIRVRAVNAPVGMKFNLSNNQCVKDLEMVKVVVEANCTGSYRAKEIQIPQQEWALPLFDYVLFNGNGSLAPN